jgi:hypothetical protein
MGVGVRGERGHFRFAHQRAYVVGLCGGLQGYHDAVGAGPGGAA